MPRWPLLVLVVGCLAAATVAAFALQSNRAANAVVPPQPTPQATIVFGGTQGRTSQSLFLDGGDYRATWSAWGVSPDEPPCTHSIELLGSGGASLELAGGVQVPATGASAQIDLAITDPGDYSLEVTSACAWQIELATQPSADR